MDDAPINQRDRINLGSSTRLTSRYDSSNNNNQEENLVKSLRFSFQQSQIFLLKGNLHQLFHALDHMSSRTEMHRSPAVWVFKGFGHGPISHHSHPFNEDIINQEIVQLLLFTMSRKVV